MINISFMLYDFSEMDRSSLILLFLIILVFLMIVSITVINLITKSKNKKYDISNKNIKKYSELINDEILVDKDKEISEEIESLELDEPKEEVIVTKPNSIEEISRLIEDTLEQEPIDLTKFEEEQEKDAIISYDELVKRAGAKKIIYRAETKAEEKKEPVVTIKEENNNEKKINKEYSSTFKASQIVSPIYGIKKTENIEENFIDLEEFKLDETKSEEERENEFLGNLKTFRNNLD